MSITRKMKNQLGKLYCYKQYITEKEVRRLKKMNPPQFELMTVCSLTAGYVKIEASIFKLDGKIQLGYDVFVKDTPDASEWICYDSPTDEVIIRESAMLAVLDRVVKENELSYTECCFERIDGRLVKKKPKEIYAVSSLVTPCKAK